MAVETYGQFNSDVLSADKPVLVDFYADWCPPCRRLKPTIEALADEYEDRVVFVKVDVDKGGQLAAAYGVRSIPTVMIFVGGKVTHRWTGDGQATQYRTALDAVLAGR